MLHHRAVMLDDQIILHIECWVGQARISVEPVHHLPQQPWFAIGTATNHHTICTALLERLVSIFDGANIAIDDHRNFDRVLDLADKGPVGAAFVHLVSCTPMNRHQLCTQIFGNMCEFGGVEARMIPTHAHLHGYRHRNSLHRRFNQAGSQRKVAHQC